MVTNWDPTSLCWLHIIHLRTVLPYPNTVFCRIMLRNDDFMELYVHLELKIHIHAQKKPSRRQQKQTRKYFHFYSSFVSLLCTTHKHVHMNIQPPLWQSTRLLISSAYQQYTLDVCVSCFPTQVWKLQTIRLTEKPGWYPSTLLQPSAVMKEESIKDYRIALSIQVNSPRASTSDIQKAAPPHPLLLVSL